MPCPRPGVVYVLETGESMSADEYRFGPSRGRLPKVVEVRRSIEPGESMTDQSQALEQDINVIVKRVLRGERPPQIADSVFADVSDLPRDFKGALEKVERVQEAFMSLPPDVRSDFSNDYREFASRLVQDPEGSRALLVERGVLKAEPTQEPPPGGRRSRSVRGRVRGRHRLIFSALQRRWGPRKGPFSRP